MPPMLKDDHENLLNELLAPDLEQSRKTEILQLLRVDYGTVHADFSDLTTNNDSLKKNNDDLVIANSKLFRELGYVGTDEKKQQKEEEKNFSETITIEALEK